MKPWPLAGALIFACGQAVAGEQPDGIRFERDVQPILARCLACHGTGKARAGLRLDMRQSATSLLESGNRAIVPGKPQESELLRRVSSAEANERMPPKGEPLTPAQIQRLRQWIAEGADWPAHWAYRPVTKPVPPQSAGAKDWARDPIDFFIRDKLVERDLTPAPEADKRTLLRRVTFDLIGLPPTPEELEAFLADNAPDAYERVVDRLLASPHYGERWARHWMDVVHFAETHGHDQDRPRDHAWPYRDYLIRAFNGDMPYARFVQEQVAGDVLFPDDPWALVGTGFLAAGPWDESSLRDIREDALDREIGRYLDRDDIVSTVIGTFASTTVHCARCHDHKFDPISQQEYYGLQAVFASTDKANRPYDADPRVGALRRELTEQRARLRQRDASAQAMLLTSSMQEEVARWESKIAQAFDEQRTIFKASSPAQNKGLPESIATILRTPAYLRTTSQRLEVGAYYLGQKLDAALAALPAQTLVYCGTSTFAPDGSFKPAPTPRPVYMLHRGDVKNRLAQAAPGALSCVPGLTFNIAPNDRPNEGRRRAALACWLSHSDNGLTWRSIANRIWQYHFGRGLVDTPNDFGRMGSAPTHPELLDWLATTLREEGGSIKKMHRRIVTSATYRQSSRHDPAYAAIDDDNRWLWRMNRQRLDAESIHDAVLRVSGKLDTRMGGPSVKQFIQTPGIHVTPNVDYASFDPDNPVNFRRSVYRFLFRTLSDPFMEALDCPDGSQCTPVRGASVTALQALALLNDKFVVRQSEHIAQSIAAERPDIGLQVQEIYRRLFGRAPTPRESQVVGAYIAKHGLANACRFLLNSNEFVFVD